MDQYLHQEKFTSIIKTTNKYFLVRKMEKLDKKHIQIRDSNLTEYLKELTKYKENRSMKNFIKYGICGRCHIFNHALSDYAVLKNYLTNELETKYITRCISCHLKDKDNDLMLYTYDELDEAIDKKTIYEFFAVNNGIRYINNSFNRLVFYSNDVHNRETRRKLIKK